MKRHTCKDCRFRGKNKKIGSRIEIWCKRLDKWMEHWEVLHHCFEWDREEKT